MKCYVVFWVNEDNFEGIAIDKEVAEKYCMKHSGCFLVETEILE